MQKMVLFIEQLSSWLPTIHAYETPVKIGNLFMNRFAIDENDSSEVLNIFELEKCSKFYKMSKEVRKQKGMDLIIKKFALRRF